jgi:hypothetical protein
VENFQGQGLIHIAAAVSVRLETLALRVHEILNAIREWRG